MSLVIFACAVLYAKSVFFRFTRLGAIFVLASASHLFEVIDLCGHDEVDLLRVLVKLGSLDSVYFDFASTSVSLLYQSIHERLL